MFSWDEGCTYTRNHLRYMYECGKQGRKTYIRVITCVICTSVGNRDERLIYLTVKKIVGENFQGGKLFIGWRGKGLY